MIKLVAHRVTIKGNNQHNVLVEIDDSQNTARLLAIQQFLKSLEPGDQRVQDQCDEYINWIEAWLRG